MQRYISKLNLDVESWIAIDDQEKYFPEIDDFIYTDGTTGITKELADKAKAMLGLLSRDQSLKGVSNYACNLCHAPLLENGGFNLCKCGAVGLNKQPNKGLLNC